MTFASGHTKEHAVQQLALVAVLAASQAASPAPAPAASAEARIVEYLKANVKPGQPVVVSKLYNEVFTAPDERAALNRMFNTFFKIPLYVAQVQKAQGRPPSLSEIGEQFRFSVPGQTEVMLQIMDADPRMPKFLKRNAETGEIESVNVDAILAHPRFGKLLERTITGFEGQPAPPFTVKRYDGMELSSQSLAGKPYLVYFWFTNCPPCVKTSPLLAELYKQYSPKGFEIVAVNADRVLELEYTDDDRAAYAKKLGLTFPLAHMTPEMQAAYGQVSVYPTLFVVDKKGTIVKYLVNFQDKAALEQAIKLALE
jgi:thiol-disulfide isomerase/thioredoxin